MNKHNLKSGHSFSTPKIFAATLLVALLAGSSAFQYVLNAATIENAANVSPDTLNFGIMYPQTTSDGTFSVSLSSSFSEQDRVSRVNYRIVQKPKCKAFGSAGECLEYFPDLCPYLAESSEDESGVEAPHEEQPYPIAAGTLTKGNSPGGDISDLWTINLKTPCFEGECPQGYNAGEFGNPLPQSLKGKNFTCDLWVEITGIGEDSNEVSPEDPNTGGPGDGNSTSTAPQAQAQPISRFIARLFQSFPVNTARAFEAHIVEARALLVGGSGFQIAAEPLVGEITELDKMLAQIVVAFYLDPLNQAAGDVKKGAKLALCVIPKITPLCVAGWAADEWFKWRFIQFDEIQKAIAVMEDPPRDDYDAVEKVKPAKPLKPAGETALDSATARYLTAVQRHADLLEALRITLERLQGAVIADEGRYMLLQGAVLRDLTERLGGNQEHRAEVIKQLAHFVAENWKEATETWLSRVIAEGFSPEERQAFLEAGLSLDEINGFEVNLAAVPPAENYLSAVLAYFEREHAVAERAAALYQDELLLIDSSLSDLLATVCPGVDKIEECVEN